MGGSLNFQRSGTIILQDTTGVRAKFILLERSNSRPVVFDLKSDAETRIVNSDKVEDEDKRRIDNKERSQAGRSAVDKDKKIKISATIIWLAHSMAASNSILFSDTAASMGSVVAILCHSSSIWQLRQSIGSGTTTGNFKETSPARTSRITCARSLGKDGVFLGRTFPPIWAETA